MLASCSLQRHRFLLISLEIPRGWILIFQFDIPITSIPLSSEGPNYRRKDVTHLTNANPRFHIFYCSFVEDTWRWSKRKHAIKIIDWRATSEFSQGLLRSHLPRSWRKSLSVRPRQTLDGIHHYLPLRIERIHGHTHLLSRLFGP